MIFFPRYVLNGDRLRSFIKNSAKTLSLILFCIAASPAIASEAIITLDDRIQIFEAWMETTRQTKSLPGISVGIVHKNKLVYANGFGEADLTSGAPITPILYLQLHQSQSHSQVLRLCSLCKKG